MASSDLMLSEDQQLGTQPDCPVPLVAGWIRIPRQAHPAAGRGRLLQCHQAAAGDDGTDHQPVEAALSHLRNRRPRYESPWTNSFGADPKAACPDSLGDPQEAKGRLDPLEL